MLKNSDDGVRCPEILLVTNMGGKYKDKAQIAVIGPNKEYPYEILLRIAENNKKHVLRRGNYFITTTYGLFTLTGGLPMSFNFMAVNQYTQQDMVNFTKQLIRYAKDFPRNTNGLIK